MICARSSYLRPGRALVLSLCLACGEPQPAAPEGPSGGRLSIEHLPDGTTVHSEVDVTEGAAVSRRRSLDLYLPAPTAPASKPALVVFVHGGFWALSDDDPQYRIGPAMAEALVQDGVAVALVRYRLAPQDRHPAAAEDVAAAIAHLIEEADTHGYDAARMFVVGHSAGGHLASLLALDPSYLGAHGIDPRQLAHVVSVSGIYDVSAPTPVNTRAFGLDLEERLAASPSSHLRAGGPPVLVVSSDRDFAGFARSARRFGNDLSRAGGAAEVCIVPDEDHFSLARSVAGGGVLRTLLRALVSGAELPRVGVAEVPADAQAERAQTWNGAEWMRPFRRDPQRIQSYPVDSRFAARLDFFFGDPAWRDDTEHDGLAHATTFEAIDLFDYVDSRPPEEVGSGRFLVLTNQRDQQLVWSREELKPFRPVLVVGVGEVQDLFSVLVEYRALRQSSWIDEERQLPMMARPLGAFLYFLERPPRELDPRVYAPFSYMGQGFRWTDEDPYATLRDVPADLFEVLTWRNGCLYCHTIREAGTRSFHTTLRSATPHGGFARPLVEYEPDVWKRFVFDPHAAAELIGVSPNIVEGDAANKLYELVNEERARQR